MKGQLQIPRGKSSLGMAVMQGMRDYAAALSKATDAASHSVNPARFNTIRHFMLSMNSLYLESTTHLLMLSALLDEAAGRRLGHRASLRIHIYRYAGCVRRVPQNWLPSCGWAAKRAPPPQHAKSDVPRTPAAVATWTFPTPAVAGWDRTDLRRDRRSSSAPGKPATTTPAPSPAALSACV